MHSIPAFLHSEFRLNLLSFAGNGMQEPVNYIILAIPVFFLLIGMEIIFDRLRKSGYYRLNDTISNINAGIAEQVTGVFFKVVVIGDTHDSPEIPNKERFGWFAKHIKKVKSLGPAATVSQR